MTAAAPWEAPDGEPAPGPWELLPLAELVHRLTAGVLRQGPVVVAVDGRSGSGKSTLAARLARLLPAAAVVHTDDIAWYESFFGWDDLLVSGVLQPACCAAEVNFRPPAWDTRARPGQIRVPGGTQVLLVEGVGASRMSLVPHIDTAVWVASDLTRARVRGIDRDGGPASEPFWDLWQAQERPFLAADRPWTRAAAIVCGTPEVLDTPVVPDTHVLVSGTTGAADFGGLKPHRPH